MLLFYFYLLGGTAERFFCPALSRISDALKMSPNIAGVTLLALGNGSPDIFSTIAAVSQGSFASSLGSQLGAGMFVTTVVAGAVALAAGKVETTVTRRPFLRDVVFYLIAVSLVFFVCWNKQISILQSLSFIGVYVIYVIVVIVGRFIYQRHKRRRLERIKHHQAMNTADIVDIGPGSVDMSEYIDDADLEDVDDEFFDGSAIPLEYSGAIVDEDADSNPVLRSINHRSAVPSLPSTYQSRRNRKITRSMKKMVYLSKFGYWGDRRLRHALNQQNNGNKSKQARGDHPSAWREPLINQGAPNDLSTSIEDEDEYPNIHFVHISQNFRFIMSSLTLRFIWFSSLVSVRTKRKTCVSTLNFLWEQLLDYFDWGIMTPREKVFFILTLPRYFIQHTTIPWAEDGKYHRLFTISHPLAIFAFIFASFQLWDVATPLGPLWIYCLSLAAILTIVVIITTNNENAPRYEPALVVVSMVMAIIWIYFIANELVSLLQSAGSMIGISSGILGITVLAWGNSVGDMIANVVVAKSGQPQMAISACFAAPMTNMMMGLGIATSIRIFKQGMQPFIIQNEDLKNNLFMAFIFLVASQILTAIVVPLSKFRFTRAYGIAQIVLYAGFTVLSILSELKLVLGGIEIWHMSQTGAAEAPFAAPFAQPSGAPSM